jgi:hypothetical protein
LTPDQLLRVNDFASNIRDGKVELPLDDRSRALSKTIAELKDKNQLLELKLQRYEMEIGGSIVASRQ